MWGPPGILLGLAQVYAVNGNKKWYSLAVETGTLFLFEDIFQSEAITEHGNCLSMMQ